MVIVSSVLQCLLYLFVQTETLQQIIIIVIFIFSPSYSHYIGCGDDDGLQFGANTSPYPEDPHWVHRENNRNPPRQELRLDRRVPQYKDKEKTPQDIDSQHKDFKTRSVPMDKDLKKTPPRQGLGIGSPGRRMRTSIVALLPPLPRLSCQTNKSTAVRLVIINFILIFFKIVEC